MSSDVDTTLRGPAAYELAKTALSEMESAGVWPTPLNFEIWLHCLGNPEGGLALELKRLLGNGALTEEDSERLAAEFLPRARLSDEIRDAGAQLSRELTSVAGAIAEAQKTQAAYGETLAEAGEDLSSGGDILLRRERPRQRTLLEHFRALQGLETVRRRDPVPPLPVL